MFGKNEIVGQKHFKEAPENSLLVTSMFLTLQGEGPYRGLPAFFIRLSKCNLNCSFCDTYFDAGDWMSYEDITVQIDRTIEEYFKGDVPTWARNRDMVLVMTGGEPMLQKNIAQFLHVIGTTFRNDQIESNGAFLQDIPETTTLVVSPKCLEKNGTAVKYLNIRAEVLDRADCLKFVMSADESSPYSDIPEWAHVWRERTGKPIFISPMNIYNRPPEKSGGDLDARSRKDEVISFWEPGLLDMESNKRNHEYAAKYCLDHGCILNLQIHLYASLA